MPVKLSESSRLECNDCRGDGCCHRKIAGVDDFDGAAAARSYFSVNFASFEDVGAVSLQSSKR